MESSLPNGGQFRAASDTSTLTKLVEEFQKDVNGLQPLDAAKKFMQILDDEWQENSAAASDRELVASTALWLVENTLPQLCSASSEEDFIETVLPVLQSSCTTSLDELNSYVTDSPDDLDAAVLVILVSGCTAVMQSCHQLVLWVESRPDGSEQICLPSFAPALLLDLLHAPLLHCQLRSAWYEQREEQLKESYLTLLTSALDATTALLNSLVSVCAAAHVSVSASMLHDVSRLCRVLSSLSHMKGVVGGWKSITVTCAALKGSPDAKKLLNDGLNVKMLLDHLTAELQEGLDLLYSLLPQLHSSEGEKEEKSSHETVVRRVVRMCTMCCKVVQAVADAFLRLCGDVMVWAVFQFCLTLSRCCVCVSQLDGSLMVGEGQSAPLLLALQLLQTTLACHPHFSHVLAESAATWIKAVRDLEEEYLASMSKASFDRAGAAVKYIWCSTCAGPLLLLQQLAAAALPQVFTLQQMESECLQLPWVVVVVLLHYLPCCRGVLTSDLSVRWDRSDGAAAQHMRLYTATLVAASLATALVTPELWPPLQHALCASVCRQPVLQDCRPCDAVAPEVWSACTELHTSAAATDRWWASVLAADLIVFVARVGSDVLCSSLYSGLCTAARYIEPWLCTSLAVLLLRLLRCLQQTEQARHLEATPQLLKGHLSSALTFDCSRPSTPAVKELCLTYITSACSEAERTISDLLACSCGSQCEGLLVLLEKRLQHLYAALSCRATDSNQTPSCLSAVAPALARLWQRFPRKCVGSRGGDWLLVRLTAVSSRLSDLFSDDQLLTILEVCRKGVECEALKGSRGRGLGEAATEMWACLSQRRFTPTNLQPITEALAGMCCALVSEKNNPWLCQKTFRTFVLFAQHTPHKQIVASILQRCSPDVKTRLQNFVLNKPHPAPVSNSSGESSSSEVDSKNPPLFLFHQQCLMNSKSTPEPAHSSSQNNDANEMKNDLTHGKVKVPSLSTHKEQENSSDSQYQEHDSTIPNKRALPDQHSAIADISKNLSLGLELIETNNVHSFIAGDHLQESLVCSEKLLQFLQLAFAGSSKKAKVDTSRS